MSFFTEAPTVHDLAVALAVEEVLWQDSSATLATQDGATPFMHQVRATPPIIGGYRPDAILSGVDYLWIVEAKRFGDLATDHSERQFRTLEILLRAYSDCKLILFVFAIQESGISVPTALSGAFMRGQVTLIEAPELTLNVDDYDQN